MSILNILSPITAHTDVQVSILTLSLAEFFSFLEIFTAYMTFLTLTSGSDFLAYISVTPSPFLAEILKATILKAVHFSVSCGYVLSFPEKSSVSPNTTPHNLLHNLCFLRFLKGRWVLWFATCQACVAQRTSSDILRVKPQQEASTTKTYFRESTVRSLKIILKVLLTLKTVFEGPLRHSSFGPRIQFCSLSSCCIQKPPIY